MNAIPKDRKTGCLPQEVPVDVGRVCPVVAAACNAVMLIRQIETKSHVVFSPRSLYAFSREG